MHGSVQDRKAGERYSKVLDRQVQKRQDQERQVNDTRRLVVGGLAHTDRWQTEVDEVATVNQYEQVNLFPVLYGFLGVLIL